MADEHWLDQPDTGVGGYRHISPLPSITKVLEHALYARIEPAINSKIGDYQIDIRKSHQQAEHLVTLRLLHEHARSNGHSFVAALIDSKGAYDCVCRNKLLQVLHNLQAPSTLLHTIQTLNDHPTLQVKFQGAMGVSSV